jgi:uncharacterized integral membrane protein
MSGGRPDDPGDGLEVFSTASPGAAGRDPRMSDREHLDRLRQDRRQKLVRAGAIVLLLVLLIVFVLQNSQPVEVHLLFVSGTPRLIWVIVFCAALGGVVGYLLARPGKSTRLHQPRAGKGRGRRR